MGNKKVIVTTSHRGVFFGEPLSSTGLAGNGNGRSYE